jgi:hypothetical protein
MLRTPRSSPASGLSTGGIVLAIAGLGTAAFLIVVFPRMSSSRAAAPRVERVAPAPEPEKKKTPKPVVLLDPITGLATPPAPAPEAQSGAAQPQTDPMVAANEVTGGAEGAVALNAAGKPVVSGPTLTYAKREGKGEVLEPGDMRARTKAKAKERLDKATEKALANGEPPPVDPRAAAKANSAGKPTRPNGKGKKKPQQPKPKDG